MKPVVPLVICIMVAALIAAGCTTTGNGGAAQTTTPVVTATTVPTTMPTSVPLIQPTFEFSDYYLNEPMGYTFQSDKDVLVKEFRVVNSSWGIKFRIQPLIDDPQYCWFKMVVENLNTGRVETMGYGREFSADTNQTIPMYSPGPYRVTMTGNKVKVWVQVGNRMP